MKRPFSRSMARIVALILAGGMVSFSVRSELDKLDDGDLSTISGQAGIYLTGDVSLNETGGPLRDEGARLAFRVKDNGGWLVLDDIRGKFSFDGLTFRIRKIDSGFGGDGGSFNRDVLEIGLPGIVRYDDVRYKLAASAEAHPTARQTDIFAVEMQGNVVMEGNLLVFPSR